MDPIDSPSPNATLAPFKETRQLDAAHDALLARLADLETGTDPESEARALRALHPQIVRLLQRAALSGRTFYADEDRSKAHSVLNLWSNVLMRAGLEHPPAKLAKFEPASAPALRDEDYPYATLGEAPRARSEQLRAWNRLLAEAAAAWSRAGLLVVVGAPGSGRAAFVRGALLPRMGEWLGGKKAIPETNVVQVGAGANPFAELANQIAVRLGQAAACAAVAPDVACAPQAVSSPLLERLRGEPEKVAQELAARGAHLFIIRRLEELFVLNEEPDQPRHLAALLALSAAGHAVVVIMRQDRV